MEQATTDILQSVLGDEFKIAVDKKDRIIKALELEAQKLQDLIDFRKKELEDLDKKKGGLNDAIILAYFDKDESLKKAQEDFEKSKLSSVSALDAREKALDAKEALHESNIQKNTEYVQKFNKEKAEFANRKKAVVETLAESLKMHSELLGDAITALQEPYEETKEPRVFS